VNFTPTSSARSISTASASVASTTSSSTITSSAAITSSSATSSSSASSTQTVPVAGKESSSTTVQATATATGAETGAATITSSRKVNAGVIAGSVVAGVAVVAGLLALLWFCRRRRNNNIINNSKPLRVTSFITQHQTGLSPVSGPFQRISPFSPEDFVSPLTAHPTHPPPPEQDISGVYTYGGPEMSQPTGAADRWGQQYQSSHAAENAPLVSEIDDFARGYHNAIDGHNDTHIHTAPDTVMGLGMGLGMGIGAPLRRGGSGNSNHRTQNRDLTAEAFRSSQRARAQSQSYNVQTDGWAPQHLRGASAELNLRGGGASSSEGSYESGSGSGSTDGRDGSRDGDESPEIAIPPKSPLRQSRILGNMAGMSTGGRSPVDDAKPRYQLVDEVVERDDVPILHSPGQLRYSRIGRRAR